MHPAHLALIVWLGMTSAAAAERAVPVGLEALDTEEMEKAMIPSASVQFATEHEEIRNNERQWLQQQEAMAARSSGDIPTPLPNPLQPQEATSTQMEFRDSMINTFGDLVRGTR